MQNEFETIWSIFIFRALADVRTYACARVFVYLKLTGRILTLIMINMNKKCLSVMKI